MKAATVPVGVLLVLSVLPCQKVPDTRIDLGSLPGASASAHVHLARRELSVYAVWSEVSASARSVRFSRSADGGGTWSPRPIALGSGNGAITPDPRIAVGTTRIHVVWTEDRSGGRRNVYYNSSADGGATWLPNDLRLDVGVPPGASDADGLVLRADHGHVHVLWHDDRASPGTSDVWYAASRDDGDTWSFPARLNTGIPAGTAADRDVAIDLLSPVVYVAWVSSRAAGGVYFNRSFDDGRTWLPVDRRVDHGGAPDGRPSITAHGSFVGVGWSDHRNHPIYSDSWVNWSLSGGDVWQATDTRLNVMVAPGSAVSRTPYLAGVATAIFTCAGDVYSSSLAGLSWSAPARLDNGGAAHSEAAGLVRFANTLVAVWTDHRHSASRPDLYCNRSLDAGATWLARDLRVDTGVAPGTGGVSEPAIAFDFFAACVAWIDGRATTGNPDVYFNLLFGQQEYGVGTRGSLGMTPLLRLQYGANIGAAAELVVSRARPRAVGITLVGGPGSQVSLPLFGGVVLVAPWTTMAFAMPGTTFTSVPLPIPVDPALVGVNVNAQVLLLDPAAAGGISMSQGLEIWIG